jgi:hypothetical protein
LPAATAPTTARRSPSVGAMCDGGSMTSPRPRQRRSRPRHCRVSRCSIGSRPESVA